jgi:hypothetical protein
VRDALELGEVVGIDLVPEGLFPDQIHPVGQPAEDTYGLEVELHGGYTGK